MQKHKPESNQLQWLADALMNEIEKPDEEIDWEYVKLCETLLSSFSPRRKLSKGGIKKRVKHILNKIDNESSVPIGNKTKPVLHKIKPAFVALIAAVVLMLSCITVCATTTLGENILKALNLEVNQSFEDEGITYIYGGKSVSYQTIDELIDTESLDICYPERLAYNIKITQVLTTENNCTIFSFNDQRISLEIYYNEYKDLTRYNISEIIEYKNYYFHIMNTNDYSYAYALINNDFYALMCNSYEQLIEMIYSFNFERID